MGEEVSYFFDDILFITLLLAVTMPVQWNGVRGTTCKDAGRVGVVLYDSDGHATPTASLTVDPAAHSTNL